jgi:hypothetical protein
LKINSITTDADAKKGPRKGKPFTITVDGEFDETHQYGVVTGDFTLKALGVVDEQVSFNQKYGFLPGMAQGPTKVTIGPFTFPRAVPGEVRMIGKITIVNEKAEAVTCLDWNLIIPKILDEDEEEDLEVSKANCGDKSTDHIRNIQSETVDGVTTSTMDLDEVLDYVNVKVDIDVKAPIVPSVKLKLTELPVALSPGIPAGPLKFVGYPVNPSDSKSNGVHVTGTLILEDKNAEEVTCVLFGDSTNAVSV